MPNVDRMAEPDVELVDAFLTASRALVGAAIRSVAAAPVPITVSQHRALVLLASGEARNVTALGDRLGVNQSNASRLVERLDRLGLVTRRRSSTDGRTVDVALSDRGRATLDAVTRERRVEIAAVLGRMAELDRRDAVRAMRAFDAAAREAADAAWPVDESPRLHAAYAARTAAR